MWLCTLQWRHNERDGVSNHQPRDCLLNRLFRCRSKKTLKFCVTDLCMGNSPVSGEFPAQMASNAENVYHLMTSSCLFIFCVYACVHGYTRLSAKSWGIQSLRRMAMTLGKLVQLKKNVPRIPNPSHQFVHIQKKTIGKLDTYQTRYNQWKLIKLPPMPCRHG